MLLAEANGPLTPDRVAASQADVRIGRAAATTGGRRALRRAPSKAGSTPKAKMLAAKSCFVGARVRTISRAGTPGKEHLRMVIASERDAKDGSCRRHTGGRFGSQAAVVSGDETEKNGKTGGTNLTTPVESAI